MRNEVIPDQHHIARYIPYTRTRRHSETDEIIGILGSALQLKENEDYLSVSWIEFYVGDWQEQFQSAANGMASRQTIGPKGAIAWASVRDFHKICVSKQQRVRIIHLDDDALNPGHSAVRRMPRDDQDLLDLLASEAFQNFTKVCDLVLVKNTLNDHT